MTDDRWLTPDIIAAVTHHMNVDHAEDTVVICRGIGGVDDVQHATFAGLDVSSATFLASTPDGDRTIRLPFSEALTSRAQIREEVARMFHESLAIVGDRAAGTDG